MPTKGAYRAGRYDLRCIQVRLPNRATESRAASRSWLAISQADDCDAHVQVLVYFAVSKLGEKPIDGKTDVNPEGLTAAHGKHATAIADRLAAGDLSCKVRRLQSRPATATICNWVCFAGCGLLHVRRQAHVWTNRWHESGVRVHIGRHPAILCTGGIDRKHVMPSSLGSRGPATCWSASLAGALMVDLPQRMQVLDREAYQKSMLEKLVWIWCAQMPQPTAYFTTLPLLPNPKPNLHLYPNPILTITPTCAGPDPTRLPSRARAG